MPVLLPGVGTMATIVGTMSVEVVFMMKTEVEMCLALLYLFGGDLEDPSQRQMAFLLAAVSTTTSPRGGTCWWTSERHLGTPCGATPAGHRRRSRCHDVRFPYHPPCAGNSDSLRCLHEESRPRGAPRGSGL